MANKRQQEIFKQQKRRALLGLLTALDNGGIPETPSKSLSSGQIIELLDDEYLRVPKSAMLEALRDAGVYHDSNNRFTTRMLHAFRDELHGQYILKNLPVGEIKFRRAEVPVTGDSQEA